jgi:hypothetical protein
MPLSATVALTVSGRHTGSGDLGTPSQSISLSAEASLTDGTGTGQADRVWSDERTLAASGTEDIDLAGVLEDAFGAGATFAKLKAVVIKAADGNTNDVQITRPASNGAPLFLAAGDGIAVRPGGCFAWFCEGTGLTVTAGTGDLLTFTNSGAGTGVTYEIVVIGVSA